jgi:cyclic lactone autoinducer peptide
MKNLRKFCAGLILTLALSVATFAGHIECGGVVDQPPPPAEASIAGDMQNGVESTDTVTGEMPNGVTDTLWLILSIF